MMVLQCEAAMCTLCAQLAGEALCTRCDICDSVSADLGDEIIAEHSSAVTQCSVAVHAAELTDVVKKAGGKCLMFVQ